MQSFFLCQQTLAQILTVRFSGCNQEKIFLLGYNQGISYGSQDISYGSNFITMKNSALFFHNQRNLLG